MRQQWGVYMHHLARRVGICMGQQWGIYMHHLARHRVGAYTRQQWEFCVFLVCLSYLFNFLFYLSGKFIVRKITLITVNDGTTNEFSAMHFINKLKHNLQPFQKP